ncbi:MAG: SagB/ThcOx family dehydrogenase [Opitutales bacterium]|nr:SagB/ThcOx family dehydrogenase [Opitutales bacterium]
MFSEKKTIIGTLSVGLAFLMMGSFKAVASSEGERVALPELAEYSSMSVEEAIAERRSVREFADSSLSDEAISRLLWAAQGITCPAQDFRAAPSAGATYPLEVYLVDQRGVFRYVPQDHELEKIGSGDRRSRLSGAALRQEVIAEAPVTIVIAAEPERTVGRYGETRAERYVHMEAGHAAQNIHLQAVALELGSVPIGAFEDEQVQSVLSLPENHQPLYLIPLGKPP